ncbi:MAG TPA: ECF-type sigma factor [Solimonas sp.]|nr:ECF-type sigma factor [Solimonas sp.]
MTVEESEDSIKGVAVQELWRDSYAELRMLARSRLRVSGPMTLLDTTGLVNQSFLKLIESGKTHLDAETRRQFFAYASSVMRSVVVDMARENLTQRRGGGAVLRLDTHNAEHVARDDDPLFVDEALEALRAREPRLAEVVEMRFFGGLTEVEIADVLGLTERTVRRDWNKARVLMRMLLK